jgi:hypothetical protein
MSLEQKYQSRNFGLMAEAINELWAVVKAGKLISMEIELELEDDNSILWDTAGLLKMARKCPQKLSQSECEHFGLTEGSTYADAARVIEEKSQGLRTAEQVLDEFSQRHGWDVKTRAHVLVSFLMSDGVIDPLIRHIQNAELAGEFEEFLTMNYDEEKAEASAN